MNKRQTPFLVLVSGCLFYGTSGNASAVLYTNSACIYSLTSNSVFQTAMLIGPTGSLTGSVTVPVSVRSSAFNVTSIAPGAFKDCIGMTGFSLDTSSRVTSVGAGAFWGCSNLTRVTLQASVTEIGPSAFLGCSALTDINLSAATGLIAVAEQTFSGCSRLTAVALPSAVTRVGRSAFRDCSSLTSMAIPSCVTVIGDAAFQGCGLLASASFPGVTALGVNAFAHSGLISVTIPVGLTNVAQGAFADCTDLDVVTYSGTPAELDSAAFKNCAALTRPPVVQSITHLAPTVFEGCSRLTSVTLPSGIVEVSDNLFENCTSLVAVTGMGNITNVGEFAFSGCPFLTNVTFMGDAPDTDNDAFTGSENVFAYYCRGTLGWKNLLACRPTVMLGEEGSVEALSFAAWAIRRELATCATLNDKGLSCLFAAESPSVSGVANGMVYAFGDSLTANDPLSLLQIYVEDGQPVVTSPCLTAEAANYVVMGIEGTTNLMSGVWNLSVNEMPLSDTARMRYTPAPINGLFPSAAFFRLKLSLIE